MGALAFATGQDELTSHLPATYQFLTTDPAWALVYVPNGVLLEQGVIAYRKKYMKHRNCLCDWVFFSSPALNFLSPVLPNKALTDSKPDLSRRTLLPVSLIPAISHLDCPATKARGRIVNLDDLKNYTTQTPVNIAYRGNRIFSTVAPSSGTVVPGQTTNPIPLRMRSNSPYRRASSDFTNPDAI